jgi:hypothetical protein
MERMEGREGGVMAESSRSELTSILGESQVIFEVLNVFNAGALDYCGCI